MHRSLAGTSGAGEKQEWQSCNRAFRPFEFCEALYQVLSLLLSSYRHSCCRFRWSLLSSLLRSSVLFFWSTLLKPPYAISESDGI